MKNKKIIIILSIVFVLGISVSLFLFINHNENKNNTNIENKTSEKDKTNKNEANQNDVIKTNLDILENLDEYENELLLCGKEDKAGSYTFDKVKSREECNSKFVLIKTITSNSKVYSNVSNNNYIGYQDETLKLYNFKTNQIITTGLSLDKYDLYDIKNVDDNLYGLVLINKKSKDYEEYDSENYEEYDSENYEEYDSENYYDDLNIRLNILSFYSFISHKTYDDYTFIDLFGKQKNNYQYVCLGKIVDDESETLMMKMSVLNLKNDSLINLKSDANYSYSDEWIEASTYFTYKNGYYLYDDNIIFGVDIYDENFNLIVEHLGDPIFYNQKIFGSKVDDGKYHPNIVVYDSKGKKINEIKKYDVINLIDNYYVIKDKNKILLLSLDDVLNNNENVIETGITLGKDEDAFFPKINNNILKIEIFDYKKKISEYERDCGGKDKFHPSKGNIYNYYYEYDLNTKKLNKQMICD